ncbi:hypothetical protein D6850_16530 [Roseovarius spongiae]|uniref:GAF domain-containing protein n=1 Tax=Roseovarius spongiae TaxID=2320272 RepID=A0A3A8B3V7_9RHOB|nr:helix-turn-helix domain-containing protein [Roseovarius spongiae]RKF12574.1 hypothetical protein D6850_16530 [Roseovarius spongiae]
MTQRTADDAGKFRKVSEIARLIYEGRDLHDALHRLTEGVCMHSAWTNSSIQALDIRRQVSRPIVRYDPNRPDTAVDILEWDAAGSPLGRIVETGQPLILRDASEQDDYPGFREDARRRGYRTVVMIPLRFADEEGRPIVFTVISDEVQEVDDAEMGFLRCLVDLADIAVRRMQILERESRETQNLRNILVNLTTALATTLDADRADDLFRALSHLFPSGWFAVDLTSGQALFDPSRPPPGLDDTISALPESLIGYCLQNDGTGAGRNVRISLDGITTHSARMKSLTIDNTPVGALFLLVEGDLSPHEEIAAQAGQFALSTLILRGYLAFRLRGHSAQRLMKRLFAGEDASLTELQEEAAILDFPMNVEMRLLAISTPEHRRPTDSAHSLVLRKAQQQFGQAISCVIDGTIFILLHDGDMLDETTGRDAFLQAIRTVLSGRPLIVQSQPITAPGQIAAAYDLCRRNLQVAESMRAEGWIARRRLGAVPAFMASIGDTVAQEFLAETIAPIAEGGSSKGRTAIETLSAFLASGRRQQETADTLEIHVSTLRYRLERLSERHGLDLTDPDQCFELELALRLYQLRNSYQT